jgi:transcriptional regulator with XRE-family HTH domain
MSSQVQQGLSTDETAALRQQAGKWLRTLREQAGLSQRELAKAVGIEYYTFISQIESGRGRLPPGQYAAFARALQVPARDFVLGLMRYYDSLTYEILFGTSDTAETPAINDNQSVAALAARIAKLETLLERRQP